MQDIQLDQQISPPSGANRAYGQVIRNTEVSRDMEYRVFTQITTAMEAVSGDKISPARTEAITRNRELWQALTWSVVDDNNQLPAALRASIAGIGMWVSRESDRVIREAAPLGSLIEMNRTIMAGLSGAPAAEGGTVPCH